MTAVMTPSDILGISSRQRSAGGTGDSPKDIFLRPGAGLCREDPNLGGRPFSLAPSCRVESEGTFDFRASIMLHFQLWHYYKTLFPFVNYKTQTFSSVVQKNFIQYPAALRPGIVRVIWEPG